MSRAAAHGRPGASAYARRAHCAIHGPDLGLLGPARGGMLGARRSSRAGDARPRRRALGRVDRDAARRHRPRRGRRRARARRRGHQLRRVDRRRRRRGARGRRAARQRRRRRQRRRAAAAGARRPRLDRLRLRRRQARSRTLESDPVAPLSAYGRTKLAGERAVADGHPSTRSSAPPGCSAPAGATSSTTMLALGAERDEVASSPTRSAARPGPATSPRRWSSSPSAAATRRLPRRRRRRLLVVRARRARSSSRPASTAASRPHDRRVPAPGAAARVLACSAASARRPCCPPGRTASPPTWRAAEVAHEAARLRRRRLHRLELRAPARARPRRRGRRPRQAHLRRAAREPAGRTSSSVRHGAIEDPRRRRRAAEGVRRGRQLRRRDARRPLDRRARRFVRTHAIGHLRAARGGPRARRRATCRSPPTRSTARSRRARSPRSSPLDPSSPYSATKAGADLLVAAYVHTYGLETRDLPRLEQLRALPVPREADPADESSTPCTATRLPVYGDGMQVRNWLYVEDFAAASATCSSTARRARSTTSAGPTSARTSRSCAGSSS